MSAALVLSLTVITGDQEAAVKAWDVLGRVAVGLALDGIQVGTNISTVEMDDDQQEEAA